MSKYLLLLGCSLCFAAPLAAQDVPDPALEEDSANYEPIILTHRIRDTYITVVASGMDDRITTTGQPISIIGQDEIGQVQGADITRILQRAPGVTISRNGGVGGFTGVRVRGAEAEQLLVVIDGVRVADPASPGGGFDFGNLLPAGIRKVELLRGSNSVIWGSQAIGGVLAVTSSDMYGAQGSLEYGARDTVFAQATGGISEEFGSLTLNGGFYRSDGFSAAEGGAEPDGFRQWQVGGRGAVYLSDSINLFAAARYADGHLDIDGFPAPAYVFADTAEFQDTRSGSGVVGASYQTRALDLTATYSLSDTERDSFDPVSGNDPTYSTNGHSERAELRGRLGVTDAVSLRFGGEREWSRFSSTFDSEQRAAISGVYGQWGYEAGGLSVNAGARLDDHSRFGSAVTFGADVSYDLSDGWRLRGSVGEGFKAPTLFQLFSDFGNQALAPERSTSADLGVTYGDRNLDTYFAASIFRRDSENLISFVSLNVSPFGIYQNTGLARAQGFEVEGGYGLSDTLSAKLAYSFVDTEDRSAGSANQGNELARRPRHAATLSGDWTPGKLRLGGDLRLVSRSFDNAANSVRLGGYAVLDLRASWQVSDAFELFGRAENVWDEQYQTAAGYGTAGRGVFVGVRAAM